MKRLFWAAFLAAALSASLRTHAHDGFRITLQGKHQVLRHGGHEVDHFFVRGHAHYRDDTQIQVGIRYEGQKDYLKWMNSQIQNEAFTAELGDWPQRLLPGQYIIEAWFLFEQQPRHVRQYMVDMKEIDNCKDDLEKVLKEDPEKGKRWKELYAKRGGRCLYRDTRGIYVLTVGTPEEFMEADIRARSFYREKFELLRKKHAEIVAEVEKHAALTKKSKQGQPSDWNKWLQTWSGEVSQCDVDLVNWKLDQLGIKYEFELYNPLTSVVLNLQNLGYIHTNVLYPDLNPREQYEPLGRSPQTVELSVKETLVILDGRLNPREEQAPEGGPEEKKGTEAPKKPS